MKRVEKLLENVWKCRKQMKNYGKILLVNKKPIFPIEEFTYSTKNKLIQIWKLKKYKFEINEISSHIKLEQRKRIIFVFSQRLLEIDNWYSF